MTLLIFLTEKEKDLYLARTAGPELVASKMKFFFGIGILLCKGYKARFPDLLALRN